MNVVLGQTLGELAAYTPHFFHRQLREQFFSTTSLKNGNKVYNPFAGACSFGVHFNNTISYEGQEIDKKVWTIGVLRLLAYNKFSSSNYNNQDSIFNWNHNDKKFDLIVSNPPFNLKLGTEIETNFG